MNRHIIGIRLHSRMTLMRNRGWRTRSKFPRRQSQDYLNTRSSDVAHDTNIRPRLAKIVPQLRHQWAATKWIVFKTCTGPIALLLAEVKMSARSGRFLTFIHFSYCHICSIIGRSAWNASFFFSLKWLQHGWRLDLQLWLKWWGIHRLRGR